MIKHKHFEQFRKIFNVELKPYVRFHGFDVLAFDSYITYVAGTEEGSLKDRVRELYGEDAVALIEEMLDTVKDELNGDLAAVEDGTEHEFKIQEMKEGFDVETNAVKIGLIYYPFALERVSKQKWDLHHLPTGYGVESNITGKANAILLAQECQAIPGLSTANFESKAFEKLKKVVRG